MSTSSTTPEAGQQPEPTPAPLTPGRLAEYAALVQAATEGPWTADGSEINSLTVWVGETCNVDNYPATNANAAFTAAARTAVPELLAEVERLTAERDELAEWKRRVTEEVEEFEDAAKDDPRTPQVARLMIAALRRAMGGAL